MTFNFGDKYEGEFYKDFIYGKGTYKFSNGDKYFGDFKKNIKHG